jgi:uncharacterized protein YhaN
MRFSRLTIPAYGPFTDFDLAFPKQETDLHILYGPNEAGKSSLLRAIEVLLFGIPGQTTDNFLHSYNRMRLVAVIEGTDGKHQYFDRRKGTKNTLLNEAGLALPETELTRWLGPVDQSFFTSMFGLNGEKLRKGAQDLLLGHGGIGETLFSASLGGTPVDKVIQALETEAQKLFAGNAQKEIRRSAKVRAEHLDKRKEVQVRPDDWKEAEEAAAKAGEELGRLETSHKIKSNRQAWLRRCMGALPLVGKLRDQQSQLEALPSLPDLPETFADALRAADSKQANLKQSIDQLDLEIAGLQERSAGCSPHAAVLERSLVIHELHTNLGAYRGNKQRASAKETEAATLKKEVVKQCLNLGITTPVERLEELRITQLQAEKARSKERALRSARLALATDRTRRDELKKQIQQRVEQMISVDTDKLTELKKLCGEAATIAERAAGLPAQCQRVSGLEQKLRSLKADLPGAPADDQRTCDLPIPVRATIEQFRFRFEESRQHLQNVDQAVKKLHKDIRDAETEIEGLTRLKEIPDLDQLAAARAHRDRGWHLVLQDWKGGGTTENLVDGTPLETAYPEAVEQADRLADRLRIEANAVAQLAEKRAKVRSLNQELVDKQSDREALQAAADTITKQWEAEWSASGLPPRSASEMMAWRETWADFRHTWEENKAARQSLDHDSKAVESVTSAMAAVLGLASPSFAEAHRAADTLLQELEQAKTDRAAAETLTKNDQSELQSLEEGLPEKEAEWKAAETEWATMAAALTLPGGLEPDVALEFLNSRRQLLSEHDQHLSLAAEAEILFAEVRAYETHVASAAREVGLASAETEHLERQLWIELERSTKAQSKLDELAEEIETKRGERDIAHTQWVLARASFKELCDKAALADESEVEGFLAAFDTYRHHSGRISELRENLAGLAGGESLDRFIAEVSAENPDSIETELGDLAHSLQSLSSRIHDAREAKFTADQRQADLERAGDEAARCEQLSRLEESRMLEDGRRYIHLSLALTLLRSQIDTFRERNQGPFLNKASQWFSRLTGGSFGRLAASYADGQKPTLVGLRPGASSMAEVSRTGMSEGTQDQLYLALRLAGWEQHLQEHPPMPLILDDILVHFDDERATHALRALQEMSRKCQVLLFTHHQHVVELARQALTPDGFTAHCIQASASSSASVSPTLSPA